MIMYIHIHITSMESVWRKMRKKYYGYTYVSCSNGGEDDDVNSCVIMIH